MSKRKNLKETLYKYIRPFIQFLFLALFFYSGFRISYPFTKNFTDNLFFNIDPLLSLTMSITGTVLIASLIGSVFLILASLAAGRFFCGWICPMGTLFDFTGFLLKSKKNKAPFSRSPMTNIKYYFLAGIIFSSIAGFTAFLFLDPLVFLFRVFALNINPAVIWFGNSIVMLIRPLASKMGWMGLSMISLNQPVFELTLISLSMFVTLITLNAVEKRFWCRNLCPLGAVIGVFSRFSLRRRNVNEECIHCSRCAQSCPMNAIGNDFHGTSRKECIQCETCVSVCPVNAVSFGLPKNASDVEVSATRRGLLFSATGGILMGLAASTTFTNKVTADGLIRPPGSLVEKDFLDSCLRCGECMKACPTNGLQPSVLQGGFEGFMTPVLVPRIGGCEELCNDCGKICPTGAIRDLPLEEKQFAVMGNAVIARNLCIAWEQGKICLICDEVCPYDAVEFRLITDEVGTIKRPFIIEDKCVGCGQCEKACPVNGPAAIFVTPVNEVRKNDGSYITDKVRELRKVKDDKVDFSQELGTRQVAPKVSVQDSSAKTPEKVPAPDDEMPAGFSQ